MGIKVKIGNSLVQFRVQIIRHKLQMKFENLSDDGHFDWRNWKFSTTLNLTNTVHRFTSFESHSFGIWNES